MLQHTDKLEPSRGNNFEKQDDEGSKQEISSKQKYKHRRAREIFNSATLQTKQALADNDNYQVDGANVNIIW